VPTSAGSGISTEIVIEQLEALATRIERLDEAVQQELQRLIHDAAGLLLDINRDYLQKQGQTVDGKAIQAQGYSAVYAKFKVKYGKYKNTAFVDLKLTGDFLASFELVQVEFLVYHIVANDEKYAFLQKYGQLLGIREADLDDFFATVLQPELESFIERYLKQ
jgi:uncharacterized protein (UPF0335 family)